MKRFTLITVVLVLFAALLPLTSASSLAQSSDERRRIEAALLTTPDKCGQPCIWDFQPGKQTVADFQSFAAALVPEISQRDARGAADGIHVDGVSLHVTAIKEPALTTVVDYIYVRTAPAPARKAGYNIEGFAPAAMIQSLGSPDQAYLLFSKAQLNKSNRFRLFLVYSTEGAIYVMTGAFREGKACLTSDSADTLTLYRFGTDTTLNAYLRQFAGTKDMLPPTIRDTTNQSPADFLRMVENPTTDCLTLK